MNNNLVLRRYTIKTLAEDQEEPKLFLKYYIDFLNGHDSFIEKLREDKNIVDVVFEYCMEIDPNSLFEFKNIDLQEVNLNETV